MRMSVSNAQVLAPGIRYVAWPMAGRNQNDVESQVKIAQTRVSLQEGLGGAADPLPLVAADRLAGLGQSGARLDFDQCEHPAAPGDQIDFPDTDPKSSGKNTIAFEAEPTGRQPFGPPAAVPGVAPAGQGHALPPSLLPSARARA